MTIEGAGQKTPQSKTGTHTKHGTYFNHIWSEPPVEKCDNGRGLYRVRYHTNAVYALVSIVSLGLYVPQTAEWWCDGTPAQADDEEEYRPGQ
ncbi:MAG: Bor family protein [Proteobacteria bacterium]|nr:Bor family protein [Pseudomonadota bacterium]MBU1739720.1 Bor family protein [Pseudomonadota bacterium]